MSAKKAADDVKSFLNKIKPLLDLGAYLDEIGSVEQFAAEANKARDVAIADKMKCLEELKSAQLDLSKALLSVKAAKDNAEQTLLDAKRSSDLILKNAKEKADAIELKAENNASVLGAKVNALLSDFEAIKKDLLTAQNADLVKKAALMQQIQKDIEEAQSRVRSLGA